MTPVSSSTGGGGATHPLKCVWMSRQFKTIKVPQKGTIMATTKVATRAAKPVQLNRTGQSRVSSVPSLR
jgi:hypothetical protein